MPEVKTSGVYCGICYNNGVHTIKLKPSSAEKHLYEKFVFCGSEEMELWG